MKSMIKYLLCMFCYFLVCGTVVAQPTFAISSADVMPGETFAIQVSADDLQSVIAMQLSINWDPNVITFLEVNDFGIPDLGLGSFGTQDISEGKIGMLWFDNSVSMDGITAPAVNLFKLQFSANSGITQDSTDISFANLPVPIEIADTSGMKIDILTESAVVNVEDPNSLEELKNVDTFIGQNVPNPFCGNTFIPIEVSKSNEVKIEIINLTGAQIYEHTEFIQPGLHKINIPGDIFPANGAYLYSVLIGEKKVSKKLFYNGK